MKKVILLYLVLMPLGCTKQKTTSIHIGAASNMQFALEEIGKAFEEETGTKCDMTFASSGQLATQILQGAPYDFYFSADKTNAQKVFRGQKALTPPRLFAQGHLVLWTNKEDIDLSLDILSTDRVKKIGIANPDFAPYGMAAYGFINQLGMSTTLESKLVYGESISQVNQFQKTGATDVVFTSKSVVLSEHFDKNDQWISIKGHEPIDQYVVRLKGKAEKTLNDAFHSFIYQEKAQGILNQYGYTTYSLK